MLGIKSSYHEKLHGSETAGKALLSVSMISRFAQIHKFEYQLQLQFAQVLDEVVR